ncbi:MAG: superoxide dismutase family protein [Clostridia bacterium]|nr:superoxide dismutase family protein [Clostridia bacterium]
MYKNNFPNFASLLNKRPHATAYLVGSSDYPALHGQVKFYQTKYGVLTVAEISGLPIEEENCENRIFGFHIHEGTSCTGNENDQFAGALTHYNPHNCPHPHHAGDLPPIFGANGKAFSAFLTNSFTLEEIIGLTIVLHSNPDDFTTQPAGNSGTKIACGVIM